MKTLPFLVALCLSIVAATAQEWIFVNGQINGKSAKLVFDTGCQNLALVPKSASRFGVKWTNQPLEAQLFPGQARLGTTEECQATFFGSTTRISFMVVDLPSYLGFQPDGFWGWWPQDQNIFRIDAADLKVDLLKNTPHEATSWTKLSLLTNSPYLLLEIPDAGTNYSVIFVDTGMDFGVNLSLQSWNEWKATHAKQARTINAYYMPSAGLVVKEEAWAGEFDFGPLRLTDVPVTEANQAQLSLGGSGCDVVLGLAALKQFDFIVDGKNGVAYFHQKQGPRPPYQHNRLGAVFAPGDSSGDDLVGHVVDGSPAYEAGIRNGDVLLKIGDLDAAKWRTDPAVLPLSRFWNRPAGDKLELTLKRGSETLQKTVVLRDILGPEKSPAAETQK